MRSKMLLLRNCYGVVVLWAACGGCNIGAHTTSSTADSGSSGVDSEEVVSVPSTETCFPTAIGTRWKWRTTITIGDGTGPLKPTVLTDSSESRIVGHEEIDGVRCLLAEKMDRLGKVVETECISIRPDGHYRYRMNQDRFAPPLRILALPAKIGTKWRVSYTFKGIPISVSSRIEGEETITVAAGTFKTIRVKANAGIMTTTTWYASGVGVVKQLFDKSIQSQKDEMELEEFIPGESPTNPLPPN